MNLTKLEPPNLDLQNRRYTFYKIVIKSGINELAFYNIVTDRQDPMVSRAHMTVRRKQSTAALLDANRWSSPTAVSPATRMAPV